MRRVEKSSSNPRIRTTHVHVHGNLSTYYMYTHAEHRLLKLHGPDWLRELLSASGQRTERFFSLSLLLSNNLVVWIDNNPSLWYFLIRMIKKMFCVVVVGGHRSLIDTGAINQRESVLYSCTTLPYIWFMEATRRMRGGRNHKQKLIFGSPLKPRQNIIY